jgi:hypothetical protein
VEAKVVKLESTVEYIQRDLADIKTDVRDIKKASSADFRIMFGALIAVSLGLAGLMAKGFQWI